MFGSQYHTVYSLLQLRVLLPCLFIRNGYSGRIQFTVVFYLHRNRLAIFTDCAHSGEQIKARISRTHKQDGGVEQDLFPCFYRHITDVGYRISRFRICGRQPDRVSAGEQENLRLTILIFLNLYGSL